MLIKGNLPQDQLVRNIPPSISSFLIANLHDSTSILDSLNVQTLTISTKEFQLTSEIVRSIISSHHIRVLILKFCSFPSNHLNERDLLSLQTESSNLHTLIIDEMTIKTSDHVIMKTFGSSMERITNLRIGSLTSSDSVHQADEIFIQLARDHLSKNRNLCQVDLRGSGIDLVAASSRRNMPINFAGELRRWARRLKGLAFETDMNVCKVLRILARQCCLLKSICICPRDSRRNISESFDFLGSLSNSPESSSQITLEPLPKLRYLCLSRNFKIIDSSLKIILNSTSGLKILNVCGCAVNFGQYWQYLPSTMEELIVDECNRTQFLKENRANVRRLLQKCPNLCIYVSPPILQGEDLESLRGLALLNGANHLLSVDSNSDDFEAEDDDDGLIAFEFKVKELKESCNCIKLF